MAVYVIGGARRRSSGSRNRLVKIGTAHNPTRRLSDLQTGSPEKLALLAVGEGDGVREEMLHVQFRQYRRHGEWFLLPVEKFDYLLRLIEGTAEFTSQRTLSIPKKAARLERARKKRKARAITAGVVSGSGLKSSRTTRRQMTPEELARFKR